MLPILAFSYAHVDESLRDQLEVHLAALKRQGLIATWHDRRVTAGRELDNTIAAQFNIAQVILLLISPEFIASDYCYGREMARAMERHERGEARVIPVILRPSDWQNLPFGKLLAVPRDGKAITTWTNKDEAFLNVVQTIKAVLGDLRDASQPVPAKQPVPDWTPAVREAAMRGLSGPRSSNLRIKKEFSDYDRDRFRREGFDYIARYFQNSLEELAARNQDIKQEFHKNEDRFTAAVYRGGKKVCAGSASVGAGVMGDSGIEYATTDTPQFGGADLTVYVKADDQQLYFEPFAMQSFGRDKEKLSMEGAAEFFWELFIRPLQ